MREGLTAAALRNTEDYEATRREVLRDPIAKAAYDKNNRQRSAASKRGPILGNLASQAEREKFDVVIMGILIASDKPLKIDEIRVSLPWRNVTRHQLGRAMHRLHDAGKITFSGNTQARVYTPARKN